MRLAGRASQANPRGRGGGLKLGWIGPGRGAFDYEPLVCRIKIALGIQFPPGSVWFIRAASEVDCVPILECRLGPESRRKQWQEMESGARGRP